MSAFSDSDVAVDALVRARSGDTTAQAAIYRAFERPVRTLARRLVPGTAAAEDVAQDVFVDVLEKLDQYDGRGSFAGWVRSIAVNRCLMYLRSPWRRGLGWVESLVTGDTDAGLERTSQCCSGDAVDLERALARLGETPRTVVWLHDVEGYTHAEIGALLGGSASFSKSQLARAHARLRELLEPDAERTTCMPAQTSF
jgi:RNA polymerase sigma-70 factor (ECF subfamily)